MRRTAAGSMAAVAALLLAVGGCASPSARGGEALPILSLAAHASEFYCAKGRWPAGVGELEAFPLPERSRLQYAPAVEPIPWPLLRGAELRPSADGSLAISARLPAGRVADAPPSRPVDLSLRVEEPGCWPPVSPGGGETP